MKDCVKDVKAARVHDKDQSRACCTEGQNTSAQAVHEHSAEHNSSTGVRSCPGRARVTTKDRKKQDLTLSKARDSACFPQQTWDPGWSTQRGRAVLLEHNQP